MTPPIPSMAQYRPGQRVRVTQQTPRLKGALTISIEGIIQRFGQQKTGSWYAHSKDDKLWLDRIELKRDDGELVVMNLDQYSVVQAIDAPDAAGTSTGSRRAG